MKIAYPNFSFEQPKAIYNLNKWLEAMREIYTKLHFGDTYKNSFGLVTASWDEVEKRDFESWLRYYQSNNHTKYKKAQFYVNDNIPGYFLPNPKSVPPVVPDMSEPVATVNKDLQERLDKEQKRKLMEDQRKKIIGRLHSAIKHLTSTEGHMLAGSEFDNLLSSMYELLKQIQTVNKVSLSNQLYKDLIIRQANKLLNIGCNRSSLFLRKLAQNTPSKFDMQEGPMPVASKLGDGVSGTLENQAPVSAIIAQPPEELAEDDPLSELSDNLETAGITDSNFSEDDLENITLDDELSIEAQMMPSSTPTPPSQSSVISNNIPTRSPQKEMEVSLSEKSQENISPDIDIVLDRALSDVTVQNVIDKLEEVVAIFRNRQLSRELMIIDLMLHKLGLSSLFNELAEAEQKTLENSNYVLTRLEKIISQLNGTVIKPDIELQPPTQIQSEEAQAVKEQITQKQDQDKANKERRKQFENDQLQQEMIPAQETPQISPVEEIINTPTPEII